MLFIAVPIAFAKGNTVHGRSSGSDSLFCSSLPIGAAGAVSGRISSSSHTDVFNQLRKEKLLNSQYSLYRSDGADLFSKAKESRSKLMELSSGTLSRRM
jgi:hypothetical protein